MKVTVRGQFLHPGRSYVLLPPSPEGSTYIQLLHIDVGQRPHPVSNKNHGRKLLSAVECGRRLKPVPRIRAE